MPQILSRLIGILVLCGLSPAAAQKVAVLDLRFEHIPPALSDPLRDRVTRTLTASNQRVVDESTAKRQLREAVLPACTLGPCLARVGKVLKVDRVLVGAVSATGNSYELTMTLLTTSGGSVLAQVNQRCDVCSFREVEEAAARSVETLQQQAAKVLASRSSLTVTTVPAAAEVAINGLPYGPAPVRTLLPPGPHSVEAMTRELPPLRRDLLLTAGEARTLTVNLLERDSSVQVTVRARPPYPGWVKWAVLSGGLALTGPGAVLWGMSGRPTEDERHLWDTRPTGIALVSVGSAAVITAGVLWWLERR